MRTRTETNGFRPLAGPGGRVLPGWVPRASVGGLSARKEFNDNRWQLRDQLFDLLQQTQAAPYDRFLIIERSDQHYVQCLSEAAGWILEKRKGGDSNHFRALAPEVKTKPAYEDPLMQRILAPPKQRGWYLEIGQVHEVMAAFLLGELEPSWLEWARVDV